MNVSQDTGKQQGSNKIGLDGDVAPRLHVAQRTSAREP
jgi:hypothetical protein